jgi:hypothetical protein
MLRTVEQPDGLQPRPYTTGRRTDLQTVQLQQGDQECVRMVCFDPVPRQRGGGEVGEIEGDDRIGMSLDRRRQNVAVIGIRQAQRVDERLIVLDQAIADVGLPERPCARQLGHGQIGSVRQQMANPLVIDPLRSLRPEEIGQGRFQQQVPDGGRV